MDLKSFRKARGLTLVETANELGLKPSSKGWLSEIETWQSLKGKPATKGGRKGCGRQASLKLALKIEKWSGGHVPASSLSEIAREVNGQGVAA